MYSRGPYKRYRIDLESVVPRRTDYYNRRELGQQTFQNGELAAGDVIVEDIINHDVPVQIEENLGVLDATPVVESLGDFQTEQESASVTGSDEDTNGYNTGSDEDSTENVDIDEREELQVFNIEDGNVPVHPGTDITKAQSMLMIVSFILRHNLTDEALKDLLSILDLLFPSMFPNSKYKFYKAFDVEECEVHFYCPLCNFYMGKDCTSRDCGNCGEEFVRENSMRNGHFFLYIPLQKQLTNLLMDPDIHSLLTNRNLQDITQSNIISDITSSKLYRQLIQQHNLSCNDISITWNADGIPIFKSSKYSIWPIQCMVNELPPHLRSKNVLLTGLWFGHSKPEMKTFLQPYVNECQQLEETGFFFKDEQVPRKVFCMICCADSPARAILKNCKQYNGVCGCDWCEHEGVPVVVNGGPPTRYYPHRGDPCLRTAQRQARYAFLAEKDQEPVKGVKGFNQLDVLPTFNPVEGFTPEYMHSVCQGVVRQMCNMWLDSGNHQEAYYLGRRVGELDGRLTAISPPSEVTRAPRSIKDRKFWKASEWRAFMLYSLVILNGILPAVYLKHFFLLVHGVYSLFGTHIDEAILGKAKACLLKFVIEMENLYGLRSCTFNVHQMVHLADGVRNCGPLWATSAFTFEANNHKLLKMFSGTQFVPQQICNAYVLSQRTTVIAMETFNEDTNPRIVRLFQKLSGVYLPTKRRRILQPNVAGLDTGKPVNLTATQAIAIGTLIGKDVENRTALVFNRFIISNILYTSIAYTRANRHNDSHVVIEHPEIKYCAVQGLYELKPDCRCDNHNLQYCECRKYCFVLVKAFQCLSRSLYLDAECGVQCDFLKEFIETDRMIAIPPARIKNKCIRMKLLQREFVCVMPCRFYGD